jgi:AraC-like DNA-binding protein
VQDWYTAAVPPGLAPYVTWVCGYRLTGSRPGVHVGMSSTSLTVVVAIGDPVVVATPGEPPRPFEAMVAGLHTGAAAIHHDGNQHGVQLDLTPAGARALLGCPASELVGAVGLGDLLHAADRAVAERVGEAATWPERADLVLEALGRRLDTGRTARPEVEHAWDRVTGSHGRLPVRAVADSVGWSTRHLGEQFRAEYGIGVKAAARVSRFSRSAAMVRSGRVPLAEVAARCGYADQAHLTREWRDLAGTTPGRWPHHDELAFVQDHEHAVAPR